MPAIGKPRKGSSPTGWFVPRDLKPATVVTGRSRRAVSGADPRSPKLGRMLRAVLRNAKGK